MIHNILITLLKRIWNIFSYFFGFPYEAQANKIDSAKADPFLRGPVNEKKDYTIYRANKVSN